LPFSPGLSAADGVAARARSQLLTKGDVVGGKEKKDDAIVIWPEEKKVA
jgi:hypothetical protein